MSEHPIQGLMQTAMSSLKEMVDVNTIVGDPVECPDGTVIIPVSKVSFGFAAGGSEFSSNPKNEKDSNNANDGLFGGGSGGGVNIEPIAFMVVGQGQIKLLPINPSSSIDRVLEFIPPFVDKINSVISTNMEKKEAKKAEKAEKSIEKTIE